MFTKIKSHKVAAVVLSLTLMSSVTGQAFAFASTEGSDKTCQTSLKNPNCEGCLICSD